MRHSLLSHSGKPVTVMLQKLLYTKPIQQQQSTGSTSRVLCRQKWTDRNIPFHDACNRPRRLDTEKNNCGNDKLYTCATSSPSSCTHKVKTMANLLKSIHSTEIIQLVTPFTTGNKIPLFQRNKLPPYSTLRMAATHINTQCYNLEIAILYIVHATFSFSKILQLTMTCSTSSLGPGFAIFSLFLSSSRTDAAKTFST